MRDVIFRAWDKDVGKMFYTGFSINGSGGGVIDAGWSGYDHPSAGTDCVLMQHTGLRGKDGVEIYEGDIVKEVSECGISGIVEYIAPKFKVAYIYEDCRSFYEAKDGKWIYDKITEYVSLLKNYWEVIGNIYENPGLLQIGG